MRAGQLDRRITIQRNGSSQSDSGEPIESWSDVATVRAQKIEARGDERFSKAQLVGTINRSFRIRWSSQISDITDIDRVLFDTVPHEIIAIREIGRREGIEIDCTARGEDAVVARPADIDEVAPTITSANSGNNPENTVLAHALTANESVTWSIIGGSDQARFEISGSTLRWASNGTKNFETPNDSNTDNTYVVQVRATDAALNTTDQTITITVTDTVEPAFSGNATVPEDTAVSSSLGTFSVTGGSGIYTYTLTSNPGSKFSISTDELILAGELDYETTTSYALEIEADNGVDPVLTLHLTINVSSTAPTVSMFSPVDGATGVGLTSNLTVQFSENVSFHTAVVITLRLTSDDTIVETFDETDIAGTISISGDTLTINPTSSLGASTSYYVLIGATSIKDTAGNFFAGISSKTTWNFTTTAGYSAEASAFFARLATQPSDPRKTLYDALISSLVSTGVWAKLDFLHIFAAADQATALTSLVSATYDATAVNSPTFTADRGFTGAATKVITTPYNPSTAGGHLTQDSASVFAWGLTSAGVAAQIVGMSANQKIEIAQHFGDGNAYGCINNGEIALAGSISSGAGLFTLSRTASNAWAYYTNATSTNTGSNASQALANGTVQYLNGNLGHYNGGEIAAGGLGSSLTAQNVTDLHAALNTYLVAVGAV